VCPGNSIATSMFMRDTQWQISRGQEEEASEEQTQQQAAEREERTEVAAQMLYHRPTRSGVYALVTLFQPWRIGLNEVNYTYALDSNERTRRYQAGSYCL
jgi:CRISPR-associated protein Cst2